MKVKTQVDELVLASGEHPFHRLVQQLISLDPIQVVIAHNAEKSENAFCHKAVAVLNRLFVFGLPGKVLASISTVPRNRSVQTSHGGLGSSRGQDAPRRCK